MLERFLLDVLEIALWSKATQRPQPQARLALPAPDELRVGFSLPPRCHYEPNATIHQKYKLEKFGGSNFEMIDSLGRDQADYLIRYLEVETLARAQELRNIEAKDRGRVFWKGFLAVIVAALILAPIIYGVALLAQPKEIPTPSPVVVATADTSPKFDAAAVARAAEQFRIAVAGSQARAVKRYPSLGVQGSHMNAAFLARYKQLAQQASSLLRNPDWPERLADECAQQVPAGYQ